VVEALEASLPQEWEMVNSGGHCSWFFAQMPSRRQEKFLTIREFGAIGNGISFAMGVAAARPDQTVVLFDGDGSLMMHVQELETIKRHGLNILIVVMNDGAYGSEIHKLRSEGMIEDGAVFGYCDFAGIARGFGLSGKDLQGLGRAAEARLGVCCQRRRRGLGLPRFGQGRVPDDSSRAPAPRESEERSRQRLSFADCGLRVRASFIQRQRRFLVEYPNLPQSWSPGFVTSLGRN
jgi:hypothetical protein